MISTVYSKINPAIIYIYIYLCITCLCCYGLCTPGKIPNPYVVFACFTRKNVVSACCFLTLVLLGCFLVEMHSVPSCFGQCFCHVCCFNKAFKKCKRSASKYTNTTTKVMLFLLVFLSVTLLMLLRATLMFEESI